MDTHHIVLADLKWQQIETCWCGGDIPEQVMKPIMNGVNEAHWNIYVMS
jgi:hypothetical protein